MTNGTIGHVALPARSSEIEQIAERLNEHFGAEILGKGSSPTIVSLWLTLDNLQIHLIADDDTAPVDPGTTHSPHLCLKIDDLNSTRVLLEDAGIATWRAGSLPDVEQLWVSLSPCFVVEIQEAVP